jgi:hypothetical protein
MKTEHKIYIAIAVLAVLIAAFYMQTKKSEKDMSSHAAPALSADLPSIKLAADDVDKVTRVSIKNADKDEVVLEKRDNAWMVVKPLEAKANDQNVKSMLDNLKSLEVKDAINATPQAPEMYKQYDLEADKAVHVVAYKGDDKAFDAWFGKSGSRGQMARVESKPGIWVVGGYSSYQFTRAVKDWRDKTIMKFEDANVANVTMTNEAGEFSFSKNGDTWTGTFNKKAIERFDPEKVKDMLRAYRALNAEDFADGKADADTGLDKPASTVVITLKDNGGTFKIQVGKTSTGSSRYARKDGDQTVYIVGSWSADWAVAKVEKFQKPDDKGKDAGADSGKKASPETPPTLGGGEDDPE